MTTLAVHDVLRQLILDGDLPENSKVSQLELSRRLSVSRTPLREALRLLEHEGLIVESRPHKMVKVSALSMVDLDDLYSMRITGEALAIWLTVPNLGKREISQVSHDLDRIGSSSPSEADLAHRSFHRRLRAGAPARLTNHLETLFEHAVRYQHFLMGQRGDTAELKRSQHEGIFDAVKAGDRDLARNLLVDHIADTAISLMAVRRHAPYALRIAQAMAKSPRADDQAGTR